MSEIDILMPARNCERTITQAVRSTLRSMPRNAKLWVLDDASTDRTLSLLEAISDDRLEVVVSEVNLGVALGLNKLLSLGHGKYVSRMDADDISLPWRFKNVSETLENVDFSFSTHLILKNDLFWISGNKPVNLSPSALELSLLVENPLSHITMNARRESIESLNGYRNTPAEDYDLWLRAAVKHKLQRRAFPSAIYRQVNAPKTQSIIKVRRDLANSPETLSSYTALCSHLGLDYSNWHQKENVPEMARYENLEPLVKFLLSSKSSLSSFEWINLSSRFQRVFGFKIN